MTCENARRIIGEKLQGSKAARYVTQSQVESVVQTCCSDVTSKACMQAMATLTAAGGCAVITSASCVPCCQFAAGIVIPVIFDGFSAVGDVAEEAYNALKDLFGLSSCDLDPAFWDAASKYVAAVHTLGVSMSKAWTLLRTKHGLPARQSLDSRLDPTQNYELLAYRDPTSGMWMPLVPETRTWPKATVRATWWSHIITANAKVLYTGPTYWWNGDGKLWLTQSVSDDPRYWFHATWQNWPCKRANEFAKVTTGALQARYAATTEAVAFLTKAMSSAFATYQTAELAAQAAAAKKVAAAKAAQDAARRTASRSVTSYVESRERKQKVMLLMAGAFGISVGVSLALKKR